MLGLWYRFSTVTQITSRVNDQSQGVAMQGRGLDSLERDLERFNSDPDSFRNAHTRVIRTGPSPSHTPHPPPSPSLQRPQPQVLSAIRERPVAEHTRSQPPVNAHPTGFPLPRKAPQPSSSAPTKQSLFKQSRQGRKSKVDGGGVVHAPSTARLGLRAEEVAEVHQQNMDKVSAMTPAQVEQAREELFSTFDPSLLAKLQSKLSAPSPSGNPNPKFSPSEASLDAQLNAVRSEDALFALSRTALPPSEQEKLRWTGEIPSKEEESSSDIVWRWSWETARFGLRGEEPKEGQPALHHHFEDQEKAGYTLKEVLALCRSGVLAQRLLGLRVLAKVLARRQKSLNEGGAAQPRHALFTLPAEVFLIARLGMDDAQETVCEAALQVVRELVVPQGQMKELAELEERCCSNIRAGVECWARLAKAQGSGEVYGRAEYAIIKIEEEEGQADEEICLKAPIQGLLRMNLLHRIEFLLPRLQTTAFEICMQIAAIVALSGHVKELQAATAVFHEAYARLSDEASSSSTRSATLRMLKRVLQAGGTLPSAPRKAPFDLVQFCMTSQDPLAADILSLLPFCGYSQAIQDNLPRILQASENLTLLCRMQVFSEELVANAPDPKSATTMRYFGAYMWNRWAEGMDLEALRVERLHVLTSLHHRKEVPQATEQELRELAFLQPLLDQSFVDSLNINLTGLDKLSAWACCIRNTARMAIGRRVLQHSRSLLIAAITSILDALTEHKEDWKVASWWSPSEVFRCREYTHIAMCVLELALYIEHPELTQVDKRIELLLQILPRSPRSTAQRAIALDISKALLSLLRAEGSQESWSYGRLIDRFTLALGPIEELQREQQLEIAAGGGALGKAFGSLLVPLGRARDSEEWDRMWGLLPMVSCPTELGIVRDALSLSASRHVQQALSPPHVLVALLQLCTKTTSDVLFDREVSTHAAQLLRYMCGKAEGVDLAKVSGGKAALFEIYRKVLVNFNQSLCGHPLPGSLLLIAMRPTAEKQLQRHLWEELVDSNLLRAVKPVEGLEEYLLSMAKGEETDDAEAVRPVAMAMVAALRLNVLTAENNRALYEHVLRRVGSYLFSSPTLKLTWEREEALIDLISSESKAYKDLVKGNEERLEVIKSIARKNDVAAKVLARDGIEF